MCDNNTVLPIGRIVILCGGLSRRMGRDKALIPHPRGGTLLGHLCRVATSTGLPVVTYSRLEQRLQDHTATELAAIPQLQWLLEMPPCGGPLLALARLQRHFPAEALLLLACDLPRLTTTLLLRLLAEPLPRRAVRLYRDAHRWHPLVGAYGPDLQPDLEAALARGVRSFKSWLPGVAVEWLQAEPQWLMNCNSPVDLLALRP